MNVKVYASGELAYDSQLPEENGYSMLSIRIQEWLNKGGTATLVLPPNHKKYNSFRAMATPVEIYRDGKLRWRGRPLPHGDDFYRRRTITCEGELCFLNDSTMRPYTLKGTPRYIFSMLIDAHNLAVDNWKKFHVGTVTVTSEAEVEISNTSPEQVYAALQKLIKLCGGYIFFDYAENGTRQINWYADMPYTCKQPVRFGENLLDYSSSASVTGLATRIIPYGAQDENGNRVKISDVPGSDYVNNKEAQSQRGIIEKAVIYDNITDPDALRAAAERDVLTCGTIPETIRLSALDMSRFDVSIDSFSVGQTVTAESDPHNLAGQYALVSLEEDLVQPGIGSVTLTKDVHYYDGSGGTLSGSLSSAITEQEAKRVSGMADAVNRATSWITNGKGYMFAVRDETGAWQEICSLDTPDINTAVNVWRWNNGGLGHSANGYNGPYHVALTQDGHIVADFITTGTLDASLVTIKNLIADHVKSVKDTRTVEINGGALGMTQKGTTLVWLSTEYDNYPIMEMYSNAGTPIFGHLRLSGDWVGLYTSASAAAAPKAYMILDGGKGKIGTDIFNGKTTSWKKNNDGTYTLIGEDQT